MNEIQRAESIIDNCDRRIREAEPEIVATLERLVGAVDAVRDLQDAAARGGPAAMGLTPNDFRVFMAALDYAWRSATARIVGREDAAAEMVETFVDGAAEHADTLRAMHSAYSRQDAAWLGLSTVQHRALLDALDFGWRTGSVARAAATAHGLRLFVARSRKFRAN